MLLELTATSFALPSTQVKLSESLRLNAELLDALIDCFSEDNLSDIEANLNFVQRVRTFSDAFYAKVK